MKIVILDGYTINPGDLSWDTINEFGSLTVYERTPKDLIASRIGDAEAVLTSKCILSKEVLEKCCNLKYIGILATGINMVDLNFAKEKGITVTNIPAYSTDSVAQLTFSLLLEIANKVGLHSHAVHNGHWQQSKDFCFCLTPQTELSGKIFGIIGFGNIGKKVSKIAEAFGMKVLISSKYPDQSFKTEQIKFVSEAEVLKNSDIISLHCPLTDNNAGFINKNSIGEMKEGVIILNTSRGPLINELDLADALKSGKVLAAGLDVLSVEPPRVQNPLLGISNCIITPHIAWITKEARERLIKTAAKNLKGFISGQEVNRIR